MLLIVAVLIGCTGAPGEAFLAYSWVSAPLSLYDENPAVPATVSNGEYVESGEGLITWSTPPGTGRAGG